MTEPLEKVVEKAQAHLQRFRGEVLGHFIDGKAHAGSSDETFDNLSPLDCSVLNKVAIGGAAEVDAAARAARRAFATWRNTTGAARRQILHKVADLIEARGEEIALVESSDTGQPAAFHERCGGARCRELPILRRSGAVSVGRSVAACSGARQLHDSPANRAGGRDHALEHAIHAVYMEDRTGARSRLHGRAQARRVEPADSDAARRES